MIASEIPYEMNKLIRLIVTAQQAQGEKCNHEHHCHRVGELMEAEGIARDLKHELELQESERVIAGSKATAAA